MIQEESRSRAQSLSVPAMSEEEIKKKALRKLKKKRAQLNKKQKWFEATQNTFVYA